MENVSVELYMIAYTLLGVMIVFLYSLPIRILAKIYKGVRNIFDNQSKGDFF